MQGGDVARHLRPEHVKLGGVGALGSRRAVFQLALEHDHVLLQASHGVARVTLFFQGRHVTRLLRHGRFQRRQFGAHGLEVGLKLGLRGFLGVDLQQHRSIDLLKTLIQIAHLPRHQALLVLGLLSQLVFELFDLQLQGFAAVVDA